MDNIFDASVISAMFRIATPLTLAALGGLMCQKAGVFNIALEGFMLVGAFAGVAFVQATGSAFIGLVGAMIFGALISALFALAVVKFKADHIIAGIAINIMSLGLTSYLLKAIFSVQGSIRLGEYTKVPNVKIPIIGDIPGIGEAIGMQSIVTYVSILLVIITIVIINKTSYGLNVRSLGESEDAALTAGVKPSRIKWSVILISGLLCGLAGAYLSTSVVSEFSENMVQGRGFNAFTAVVFGNANPLATWLVTLLFGFADAIGIRIELAGTGIPPSIVKMFPYLLAIVALTVSAAFNNSKHKLTRRVKVKKTNKKTAKVL